MDLGAYFEKQTGLSPVSVPEAFALFNQMVGEEQAGPGSIQQWIYQAKQAEPVALPGLLKLAYLYDRPEAAAGLLTVYTKTYPPAQYSVETLKTLRFPLATQVPVAWSKEPQTVCEKMYRHVYAADLVANKAISAIRDYRFATEVNRESAEKEYVAAQIEVNHHHYNRLQSVEGYRRLYPKSGKGNEYTGNPQQTY